MYQLIHLCNNLLKKSPTKAHFGQKTSITDFGFPKFGNFSFFKIQTFEKLKFFCVCNSSHFLRKSKPSSLTRALPYQPVFCRSSSNVLAKSEASPRRSPNDGVNNRKQRSDGRARRGEPGGGRAVAPQAREAQADVQVSRVRQIVGFVFEPSSSCLRLDLVAEKI